MVAKSLQYLTSAIMDDQKFRKFWEFNATMYNMTPDAAKRLYALHHASAFGPIDEFERVLNEQVAGNCVKINLPDVSGNTPLHVAVMAHNYQAAYSLLRHGALIGAMNNDGDTPIHIACDKNNSVADRWGGTPKPRYDAGEAVRILELLLANKADYPVENNDGWSAAKKVMSSTNKPLRRLIADHKLESQVEALCMGAHPRLGADSPFRHLSGDERGMIAELLGWDRVPF
jgi:ankyrin repeat protein